MEIFVLIYRHMYFKKVSDLNQNMINKIYSVKNIPVGEIINNMNSLYVPEDCNHDFECSNKLFHYLRDICVQKKPDPGILKKIGNQDSSPVNKKNRSQFFGFCEDDKEYSIFSAHSAHCFPARLHNTNRYFRE
jgi:hypothetical protein